MTKITIPETWLQPQWSVPDKVFACVTTKLGGVSRAPFESLNLGLHVGDDAECVRKNREQLSQILPFDSPVQWLEQVHGIEVINASEDGITRIADAAYIDCIGVVAAVMTADCLPVFFASRNAKRVAIAHAGWRGLLNGILENTLARFPDDPSDVSVWFGPAIGQCHFEVGEEVRDAFLSASSAQKGLSRTISQAFQAGDTDHKFFADIYALARLRLQALGVVDITGGGHCTYCESDHFYSYRREARTGRFASIIGLMR